MPPPMFAYEGRLNDRLTSTDAMLAIFGPSATVQRMLDVEAALARSLAQAGVIPADAVASIVAACQAEFIDADALTGAAASAGKAMGKDAALKILGKRFAHEGLGGVVVALAVELTRAGQL